MNYDYNHPGPVQVRRITKRSPESLTGAAGALTAIQFNNAPNVFVNSRTPPSLLATYTGLTNPVNIATLPGIVYTSSDPAVAVFDADGNIHAVGLGTTMLQAEYQSLVTTLELTVGSEPVVLLHRYSFDGAPESTTITDSVAGEWDVDQSIGDRGPDRDGPAQPGWEPEHGLCRVAARDGRQSDECHLPNLGEWP
jgi:hypothetical protein